MTRLHISSAIPRLSERVALALVIVATLGAIFWAQSDNALAATTIVLVGQRSDGNSANEFNANTVGITEGDTIQWDYFSGTHNVTPAFGTEPPATSITHFSGAGTTYSWTFNTAGTYWYYCTLHAAPEDIDTNGDGVVNGSDSPDFGKMIGRVDVSPAVVDTTGPAVSGTAVTPIPTNGAAGVTLTATADDTATGGSSIAAAEYFIDTLGAAGTGTAMSASDGSFNSATEGVTANVGVSALALGTHNIYVRARDSAGNWGGADLGSFDVTSVPAGAESATVTIQGGTLSVATTPVAFGTISLSGVDQTVDTQPTPWNATDARGSGAGWNVTLTSTSFSSAGGTITVDNFKMKLDDVNIATISGNTPPTSQATTYQPLDSVTPLKLIAAAATTGMGSYDFTPDTRLVVPAESAPGAYEAFMTVSINSGP
jgi:plastocyanin